MSFGMKTSAGHVLQLKNCSLPDSCGTVSAGSLHQANRVANCRPKELQEPKTDSRSLASRVCHYQAKTETRRLKVGNRGQKIKVDFYILNTNGAKLLGRIENLFTSVRVQRRTVLVPYARSSYLADGASRPYPDTHYT
jgi:hypothetical protein